MTKVSLMLFWAACSNICKGNSAKFGFVSFPSRALSMSINQRACFGAGCYWGTEKFFKVDFGKKKFPGSVLEGAVGFMGPP